MQGSNNDHMLTLNQTNLCKSHYMCLCLDADFYSEIITFLLD